MPRSPRARRAIISADDYLGETAVSDESELDPAIERVLAANPDQVATYRGGKEGVLGFLVGQVMKETGGKADPKVVNRLLREKLQGRQVVEVVEARRVANRRARGSRTRRARRGSPAKIATVVLAENEPSSRPAASGPSGIPQSAIVRATLFTRPVSRSGTTATR